MRRSSQFVASAVLAGSLCAGAHGQGAGGASGGAGAGTAGVGAAGAAGAGGGAAAGGVVTGSPNGQGPPGGVAVGGNPNNAPAGIPNAQVPPTVPGGDLGNPNFAPGGIPGAQIPPTGLGGLDNPNFSPAGIPGAQVPGGLPAFAPAGIPNAQLPFPDSSRGNAVGYLQSPLFNELALRLGGLRPYLSNTPFNPGAFTGAGGSSGYFGLNGTFAGFGGPIGFAGLAGPYLGLGDVLLRTPALQQELGISPAQLHGIQQFTQDSTGRLDSLYQDFFGGSTLAAPDPVRATNNAGVDATGRLLGSRAESNANPSNPDSAQPAGPPPSGASSRLTLDASRARELSEAVQQLRNDNRAALAQVLNPQQMTRLEQLRLQIVGPTAIAEPEVARALNLNQTQAQQVQEISTRFNQQTADLTTRYFRELNDSNAGASTGPGEQAAGESSANAPSPAGRIVGDRRTFNGAAAAPGDAGSNNEQGSTTPRRSTSPDTPTPTSGTLPPAATTGPLSPNADQFGIKGATSPRSGASRSAEATAAPGGAPTRGLGALSDANASPAPAGRIVGDRRTFSNSGSSSTAQPAAIGTSSYGTISGDSSATGSRAPIPADNGTLTGATAPSSESAATPIAKDASDASPRTGGDVPVTSGGARNGAGPADVASQKVRETGSEAEGLDTLRRAVPARQSRGISERLYARHLTELRESAERDIREVLSPTQWQQYSDLLGPPFNFAALFQSTPVPAAADAVP